MISIYVRDECIGEAATLLRAAEAIIDALTKGPGLPYVEGQAKGGYVVFRPEAEPSLALLFRQEHPNAQCYRAYMVIGSTLLDYGVEVFEG